MQNLLTLMAYIWANLDQIVAAVSAVLTALIVLFALIPGDQPEKFLKGVVEFIAKFSRKPKASEIKNE